MRSKLGVVVLSGLAFVFLGAFSLGVAADPPKEKITYQDNVVAVFRNRCGSCHNPDKQKGGLNLDNYGAAMQGGGSGKVVEPGDAEQHALPGDFAPRRAQDAAEVAQDPRRRDRD